METLFEMAERPPIRATGIITKVHESGRLYEVEMQNGYRAYAIVELKGPAPVSDDPVGDSVTVHYSPFDMSKCKVVEWIS